MPMIPDTGVRMGGVFARWHSHPAAAYHSFLSLPSHRHPLPLRATRPPKSGELHYGGDSHWPMGCRVPGLEVDWAFSVHMGRSLLSSVMLDWIVGHCRDVGTMYAPGRQSLAKPGGASSSRNEVAWRMRTKLTLACCFEGVVPVIKSLCVRTAPKTRSGL